jgi:lycopene beta-cyclase
VTYFGFLLLFVGVPFLGFAAVSWWDDRRGLKLPEPLTSWHPYRVIAGLAVVAVVYTTPWDNYLVASRVWWYDPALVTGIVIGYVPLEEYTFFVVQTLFTGLFTLLLLRRLPEARRIDSPRGAMRFRAITAGAVTAVWIASMLLLILSYRGEPWLQFRYLGLELGRALPPIMLQLIVGADILWRHRWATASAIGISWLYLSFADALAIRSGTWTINPEMSLPIFIGGVLPIEEAIFFLVTNVLLVFGLTLVLDQESEERVPAIVRRWLQQRKIAIQVRARETSKTDAP